MIQPQFGKAYYIPLGAGPSNESNQLTKELLEKVEDAHKQHSARLALTGDHYNLFDDELAGGIGLILYTNEDADAFYNIQPEFKEAISTFPHNIKPNSALKNFVDNYFDPSVSSAFSKLNPTKALAFIEDFLKTNS